MVRVTHRVSFLRVRKEDVYKRQVVFHTTGRKDALDSGMRYRKQTVAMGLPSLSEYEIWQTDEEEFRACAEIVHSFAGAGA